MLQEPRPGTPGILQKQTQLLSCLPLGIYTIRLHKNFGLKVEYQQKESQVTLLYSLVNLNDQKGEYETSKIESWPQEAQDEIQKFFVLLDQAERKTKFWKKKILK